MTGSAQDAPQPRLVCCICAGQVALEASKTDAHGKAVHEECYVRQTISRFRRGRVVRLSRNWERRARIVTTAWFSQLSQSHPDL
jgi:hypothetical protein